MSPSTAIDIRQTSPDASTAETWSASRSREARVPLRRSNWTRGRSCAGEVLETVPACHQPAQREARPIKYYLRGFTHHGTDFATTVAAFRSTCDARARPRLFGSEFSDSGAGERRAVLEGPPYFADQGDFATPAPQHQHTNTLAVRSSRGGGDEGYGAGAGRRVAGAGAGICWRRSKSSPTTARGRTGTTCEDERLLRYSRATASTVRAHRMAYRGSWRSTDQIRCAPVEEGVVGRFGAVDPTDGANYRTADRSSAADARQRVDEVTRSGLATPQPLFELHVLPRRPAHGDQFQQAIIASSPARGAHRRLTRWGGRSVQTFGVRCATTTSRRSALSHRGAPPARRYAAGRRAADQRPCTRRTRSNDAWLRTLAGVRADGYRFKVAAAIP